MNPLRIHNRILSGTLKVKTVYYSTEGGAWPNGLDFSNPWPPAKLPKAVRPQPQILNLQP